MHICMDAWIASSANTDLTSISCAISATTALRRQPLPDILTVHFRYRPMLRLHPHIRQSDLYLRHCFISSAIQSRHTHAAESSVRASSSMSSQKPKFERVFDQAQAGMDNNVRSLDDLDTDTATKIANAERQVYGTEGSMEFAGMGAQAKAAAAANEGKTSGAPSMAAGEPCVRVACVP